MTHPFPTLPSSDLVSQNQRNLMALVGKQSSPAPSPQLRLGSISPARQPVRWRIESWMPAFAGMTQPGRFASPAGTTPQPTLFPTTPLLCHDVPALTSSLTSPERNSRRPSSARTPQFRVIVPPPQIGNTHV